MIKFTTLAYKLVCRAEYQRNLKVSYSVAGRCLQRSEGRTILKMLVSGQVVTLSASNNFASKQEIHLLQGLLV